ncbi:hypothetical protein Tco_0031880 [Tanacetum coccineum]
MLAMLVIITGTSKSRQHGNVLELIDEDELCTEMSLSHEENLGKTCFESIFDTPVRTSFTRAVSVVNQNLLVISDIDVVGRECWTGLTRWLWMPLSHYSLGNFIQSGGLNLRELSFNHLSAFEMTKSSTNLEMEVGEFFIPCSWCLFCRLYNAFREYGNFCQDAMASTNPLVGLRTLFLQRAHFKVMNFASESAMASIDVLWFGSTHGESTHTHLPSGSS